jgi:2'-hydroxyisoflavone reductase
VKLLIIGGTVFLGRHLVNSALARGHEVTLFNRGKSNPELFPNVEKIHGDRTTDLAMLRGRQWDVVIDTCGYAPRYIRETLEVLADSIAHYTFISTVSVYSDPSPVGMDESSPVAVLEKDTEEITGETYGALKALCEQVAEAAMPGRVLNVRAGLLVGPFDYSGRFPYWIKRIAQGGEVLAPGRPERVTQIIDTRDLADWNILMAEKRHVGTLNVTGNPVPMGELLQMCKTVTGSDAKLTWVDQDFLEQNEVTPWQELPIWLPENAGFDGMMTTSIAKAVAEGLTFRPLVETVQDTWNWMNTPPDASGAAKRVMETNAGLAPEKETAVLEKWHNRQV